MKIITSFDFPPIPIRNFDWSAVTDNYDEGAPVGHGRTEAEAIADLQWQLDQEFLTELEARSMSTWSESETARYNELTGQEFESGSDALTERERVAGLKA